MATVQHKNNPPVPVPQFIRLLWVTELDVDGNPGDQNQIDVIEYLRSLGHTVDVVDDSVGGDPNLYSVVFIHEDVGSSTAFANLPGMNTSVTGLVVAETFLVDDYFGGPQGNPDPSSQLTVVDNLHPITLQMSLGDFDVGAQLYSFIGTSGRTLIEDTISGLPKLVTWETGDPLDAGHSPALATGRRVFFDFRNDFGATLNPIGVLLFVRCALWAGRAI